GGAGVVVAVGGWGAGVVGGWVVVVVGGSVVVVVGGRVVVVRIEISASARAWSRWVALRRSATIDVSEPAASTASLPPFSPGTRALATSTGPTRRAMPATPPATARRAERPRFEPSSGLGGWSVRRSEEHTS